MPRTLVTSLLISLIACLAIGCDSSGDPTNSDFVFTGNSAGANQIGNLNFQFIQPQAVTAPAGTLTVRFDVYGGPNGTGTLIFTETQNIAPLITLVGVPTSAESVIITAFGANNTPLGILTDTVEVTAGASANVDLSAATFGAVTISSLSATPDPLELVVSNTGGFTFVATFSNSSSTLVPPADIEYTVTTAGIVNVSAAGVFTAVNDGTTSVQMTYNANDSVGSTSATIVVTNPPK